MCVCVCVCVCVSVSVSVCDTVSRTLHSHRVDVASDIFHLGSADYRRVLLSVFCQQRGPTLSLPSCLLRCIAHSLPVRLINAPTSHLCCRPPSQENMRRNAVIGLLMYKEHGGKAAARSVGQSR